MIPKQSDLDRIEHELGTREAERSNYWRDGRFSLRGLAYVQELVSRLPNTKSEALAALKGKADASVTADDLPLTGIGWTARPLAAIHETQRREIVEQAIARLKETDDPVLRAAARIVAASLPNYREAYEARLAPLQAWAGSHAVEIQEQELV